MSGKDYKFLYWDDYESEDAKKPEFKDWQKEIFKKELNWDVDKEAEDRITIIKRKGNSGEHCDTYDDGEYDDVE